MFHRIKNCTQDEARQAGLWPTYIHSVSCVNGLYVGNNRVWHNKLMDAALTESSKLGPDHPTVLRFWPIHLRTHGLLHSKDDAVVGKAARANWVRSLPHALGGHLLHKTSTGEFFGLNRAERDHDRLQAEKCVVLTQMCIANGWSATIEDLEAPVSKLSLQNVTGGKRIAAAKAKAKAKEEWEVIQSKTQNRLHAVASVTINTDHLIRKRTYLLGSSEVFNWFNDLYANLTSPDACFEFIQQMSQDGIMNVCKSIWASVQNLDSLEKLHLTTHFDEGSVTPGPSRDAKVHFENAIMHNLGSFTDGLIASLLAFFLPYSELAPLKYARLANSDAAIVNEVLEEMGEDVAAWHKASDRQIPFCISCFESFCI